LSDTRQPRSEIGGSSGAAFLQSVKDFRSTLAATPVNEKR
jgi:hypothetical protein